MRQNTSDGDAVRGGGRPTKSLLKSWGKRMAKGKVPMVPIFVGGAWTLQVTRGNKRVLRIGVPGKPQR